MRHVKAVLALYLLGITTSCVPFGELGLKSLPVPTYTLVHNAAAMNFLRTPTPIDGTLGAGLAIKPMATDGRLAGLAVSGGGQRAAAFTLGVLAELQTIDLGGGQTALDRIDYISSNSGGGWGVAQYLVGRSNSGAEYRLNDHRDGPNGIVETFVRRAAGRVPCWHAAMTGILGGETFGQMYRAGRPDPLPAAFFNAALLPAQSPFVFTDAFVKRYEVSAFDACRGGQNVSVASLADVPIAYAAATSGTVPMFYYAFAATRLCDENPEAAATPSFCNARLARDRRSYLRLADGGVYDNLGYKTAWQVMSAVKKQYAEAAPLKQAMILINSGTDTPHQLVPWRQRDDSFVKDVFVNGLFAVQDATLAQLYGEMFKAIGVPDPLILDFYSTAGFREEQVPLLRGLDHLVKAANQGDCASDRQSLAATSRAVKFTEANIAPRDVDRLIANDDCFAMGFFRVGNRAKTTYKFDKDWTLALWELGQLSVRMRMNEIKQALK